MTRAILTATVTEPATKTRTKTMPWKLPNALKCSLITLICSWPLSNGELSASTAVSSSTSSSPSVPAASSLPEGQIQSPFQACQNVILVDDKKYDKNKAAWLEFEKNCGLKVQTTVAGGFTAINPLNEAVQYVSLAQKVAKKIVSNLEKSQKYAECSRQCYTNSKADLKICGPVDCNDRKKQIQYTMAVDSRRLRMELALSQEAPGIVNVNIRNVIKVSNEDPSKLINTNLRGFEAGLPNPVGNSKLTPREMKEAQRRLGQDRKKHEEEFNAKGYNNYSDWMSVALMKNFELHRERYRSLLYQEAPIFAVIDPPIKMENDNDPIWSDSQMAEAFGKLKANAEAVQKKVEWSLQKSTLEFDRGNGDAFGHWLYSLAPGTQEQNDLLYYMGMKNQVEEVLRENPDLCGIATAMEARLHTKELQNSALSLAASLGGGVALKSLSAVASPLLNRVFSIGRGLSVAEAAAVAGLAQGSVDLASSFQRYKGSVEAAASRSGTGEYEDEGSSLVEASQVAGTREGLATGISFLPLQLAGSWGLGRTLYGSLAQQMAKDLPEVSSLAKKASLDFKARDQLVDQWLGQKVKGAFQTGAITEAERKSFESQNARQVFENLVASIDKKNPLFFRDPENMNFFFKTAASVLVKQKGDPVDLGRKTESLLHHLSPDAMNGNWDSEAKQGLLNVFDKAIDELRKAAKSDPTAYAKFETDPAARQKLLKNALEKAGAKESDTQEMLKCAMP